MNTKKLILLFFLPMQMVFAQKLERTISGIHAGSINGLAITFDGSKALTAGNDNKATIWNTNDGSKLRAFAQDDAVTSVDFSNDQVIFATASKNMSIVTWDGSSFKPKKILKAHTAPVIGLCFHPFNSQLLSVAVNGEVNLWDAGSGKLLTAGFVKLDKTNIHTAYIKYSKTASSFAVQADENLSIYKTDGTLIKSIAVSGNVKDRHYFDFSFDGSQLAYKASNNQIEIINPETGSTLQSISGDFKLLSSVVFSPNNGVLLLGKENGALDVFSITDKKNIASFTAHAGGVVNAATSVDGKYVITTGIDFSLKKWNIESLKLEKTVSSSNVASIANVNLIDDNKNGLLDFGEKADLSFEVRNTGKTNLLDAVVKISGEQIVEGLEIPAAVFAGNLTGSTLKTLVVPLKIAANLGSGASSIKLELISGGVKLGEQNAILRTGSSANAAVAIKQYQFFSPDGKAGKGEPITLLITLENITRIVAENIEVRFKLPMGVAAIDKVKERIAKIAPGEKANVSIQFTINNEFALDTMVAGLELTGVSYSNAGEVRLTLPLNKTIYTTGDLLALIDKGPGSKPANSVQAMDFGDGVAIEKIRYVVLTIGINSYEGSWPKLGNAVNDAKASAAELQKSYNFTVNRSLYDKEATRENIIREFEWLVDNLTEGDNLLIFYSGHGEFKEALNKGFWVPVDATTNSTSNLISNSDIQTFLSSIPAKHTLLVSDACFSGDIFRGAERVSSEVNDKYYQRANSLKSREAITSGGIEPVMDGGKDGHSIFTYYFLKALRENQQKFVDAAQLFEAIKIPIVNNSDQAPKFSHIKNTGDEGGEFIFFKKK